MNQHIIASVQTARADGQLADDALLLHNAAIDWGHDDMAATYLETYNRLIARLEEDAYAEYAGR